MIDLLRKNVRPLLCLAVFAAIWTIELWAVQAGTMPIRHSGGPRHDLISQIVRFAIDATFVVAICALIPRRGLIAIALLSLISSLVLVSYFNYFDNALSAVTIVNSWREGMTMAPFALSWVPSLPASILIGACIAKLFLLSKTKSLTLPPKFRLSLGAIAVLFFSALYFATTIFDPLSGVLKNRNVARLGMSRGYIGPWLAELYYLNDPQILKNAIELSKCERDELTPIEAPIPIHKKLVIVQMESFDFGLLGYRYRGKEVTPFLNELRKQSMFFRARSYHTLGSADADFSMLSGGLPGKSVLNYSLPDFPYDNALPRFLANHGFAVTSFHGNYGSFYRRRQAFEKMGFFEIKFREELDRLGSMKTDRIGIKDQDVFAMSSLLLRQSQGQVCHFIITLTSHSPYLFVEPSESSPEQNPQSEVQRYFNHAQYLDTCLRDYISSLGSGTTVVLYSDHPCFLEGDGFKSDYQSGFKPVPVFIYDTDTNLAEVQMSDESGVATDGNLEMLDISSYLRNQVARSFPSVITPSKPIASK